VYHTVLLKVASICHSKGEKNPSIVLKSELLFIAWVESVDDKDDPYCM